MLNNTAYGPGCGGKGEGKGNADRKSMRKREFGGESDGKGAKGKGCGGKAFSREGFFLFGKDKGGKGEHTERGGEHTQAGFVG